MTSNPDSGLDASRSGATRARASRRGRPALGAATAAATTVALIVVAALGAGVVRNEWLSAQSEAAVVRTLGGPAPLPWETPASEDVCAATACPPRALAASGVQLLLTAEKVADPARRRGLIALAQDRLAGALAVRPSSGGWWAWVAYGRALDGDGTASTLQALEKSYAAAPFLLREGPWRVRYGAANWRRLSPALRAAVIDEEVWMRDVDPPGAAMAIVAFTDPSASAALRDAWAARPSSSVADRRSGGPGGVHLTR